MNNSEVYKKVRDRYKWQGTMTDAAIIVKQEEEIERYRDKIDYLEDKHREKVCRIACLEEENRKLREESAKERLHKKTVRLGDIVKFENGDESITFKVVNLIINWGYWEDHNVELCGTLIALEKDRSE